MKRTTVVKWGRDSRIWESWNDRCLTLQQRISSWHFGDVTFGKSCRRDDYGNICCAV
uniref:Bm1369 n=1 Tax=Brugia malayi TaxID=6279 RepID=A0A1I9G716_BRUMA|nr:Bm1369 [Brugia malayi]